MRVRCGCWVVSCAKSPKVHGWVGPGIPESALGCGCQAVLCAKSPKVHGFARAMPSRAAAHPYTFGDLAHAGGFCLHERALHPRSALAHPYTFGDLAHAGGGHLHLGWPRGARGQRSTRTPWRPTRRAGQLGEARPRCRTIPRTCRLPASPEAPCSPSYSSSS